MPKGHYSADKHRPGYNTTKGRPHLKGNKSRTGQPKPIGSGRKNELGVRTRLTIWISAQQKQEFDAMAKARGFTVASRIREMIAECLEMDHVYPTP